MQTPLSFFFEYVNTRLMAALGGRAPVGWMTFRLSRPVWPISAHVSPSSISSRRPCAMIAVIGLKKESSLALCY